MKEVLEPIINELANFSVKIVIAVLIIVIGLRVVKFVMKKIKKGKGFNKLEKSTQTFIYSILNILLKGLVFLTAITEVGIPMTSVIAVLGSAGLALGLALQGGLSNIAGGVMIMLFKPFKVGDFIDTNSYSGTVKEINIFNTVLTTYDNKKIIMPNGDLSNSVVVNSTAMKNRLLDITVSVDYKSSIEDVKNILLKIAKDCKYRVKDEDILVALKEHGSSSLNFTFRIWVLKEDYWTAKFELLEMIKNTLDENGISIPYPKLDVNITK
ncbi:MAG: mechanosensitive ion channel [Bacilli bacterium]|nr:mechanosensitive ion channel [Bacilli bacterium]